MAIDHAAPRRGALRVLESPRLRTGVIALISVIFGTVVALNVVTVLMPPRLSLLLAVSGPGHARVAWVMPGGTLWEQDIRAGDTVLTLDGHRPMRQDGGIWAGRRLQVRIESGATILVDAQAQGAQATWPLLVLSPWFLLLGTLVVRQATRPTVGGACYALFACAAFALALAPGADTDGVVATVAEWIMAALFAYSFACFFLTFPTPRGTPRLRVYLLAPPLGGVLSGLAALRWPALYDAAYLTRMAILLIYLAIGISLLVFSFVTAPDRETRRKLTIMSAGTVASVLPFVTLVLLPTVLGHTPVLPAEQAILALGLLPLSFAYAILRHGLLNVHLLQRWLVYGLLWLTVLVVGAAAVSVLRLLPGAAPPEPQRSLALAALLALALGIGFSVRWLHDHVQRVLDHFIFKDAYDYGHSLQGLSHDLSLMGDLDTLGASLPATLRQLMNLDFAVLLVHTDRGSRVHGVAGAYQPALEAALIEAAGGVRDSPRVVLLGEDAVSILLAPLCVQGALVGHLCLGPKTRGEPFRAVDRALLATISGYLAAIVRNIQLVDVLHTQVRLLDTLNERLQRAYDEERAHLAADLHDEPLQTAYYLQRQLMADGQGRAATARHVALSQALIHQLHALCTAVRPAALDELGLASAIEVLALDRTAHADVLIRLDTGADLSGADLPPGADLVLYRTAQEALTNSLRHGRPHTIGISLRRYTDVVRLRVTDDGDGFVAPRQVDDLAAAGHLGLVGLQHRVQRVGGQLAVTSTPGTGTVVQVELPLVRATA